MGPFNTEEGVTVDTCGACKSVWFDRGELARMVNTREDLPSLDAASDLSNATSLPCPRCLGSSLVEMPYAPGHKVNIATCPTCQGVLSSLTDLRPMRELAAAARMSHAPAQPAFAQPAFGDASAFALATAPGAALSTRGEAAFATVSPRFSDYTRLAVKQRRSWFEAITGFEQPNQYTVLANGGGAAFVVQEQSQGLAEMFMRLFLGPWRPFESHVEDTRRGTIAMRLRRPFRWFLPELVVCDADGNEIARIVKRWTWFASRYEIVDATGLLLGEVNGPFFRPWTFEISDGTKPVAMVRKKWSGLITEAFTDADNFEVTFEEGASPMWKPLSLACAVLIDVVHFERSNK